MPGPRQIEPAVPEAKERQGKIEQASRKLIGGDQKNTRSTAARLDSVEAPLEVGELSRQMFEALAGRPNSGNLIERVLQVAKVVAERFEVSIQERKAWKLAASLPMAQRPEVGCAIDFRGRGLSEAQAGPDQAKRFGDWEALLRSSHRRFLHRQGFLVGGQCQSACAGNPFL